MTEQAPATPPVGKGTYYAIISVVVVLLAGCCYGGTRLLGGGGGDPPKAAGLVATPQPSGSPTESRLSAQDYQAALIASDQALKSRISALSAEDRGPLADSLRSEGGKLAELPTPINARRATREVAAALLVFASAVEGTGRSSCKAASAAAGTLSSDAANSVRKAATALRAIDRSYVFGTFLPAAPKEQNRRLANGTIITKRAGGPGSLEIRNSSGDKAISLVPVKSKKAVLTFYLRSGKSKTIRSIKSGTLRMYVASGEDWDSKAKGFTRDCSYTEFDDTYKFSAGYIWTIQLTKQIGGNASTSDADPNAFEG